MTPQKQTKKVFKSIRDVPSAFNNVSTATGFNFKATELNKQTTFLSLYLLNFHLCHATVGFLNLFPRY